MPKLKLTVDKLDDVKDEALRALYVERDGRFELDVDGVPDLRAALKTANAEAASLRRKYKDVDVDDLQSRIETTTRELEELRAKSGPDAVNAIKQQLLNAHGAEKRKLEERLARLQGALETALVDGEAIKVISEAKGSSALLLPHVRRHVKIAESDDGFTVRVVDAKGNPRVRDDGSPLTIKSLVEEMRSNPDFGRAFDSSGAGGTGSGASGGGGGAAKKRSQMSVSEKAAFVEEHGQEAYFKLPL